MGVTLALNRSRNARGTGGLQSLAAGTLLAFGAVGCGGEPEAVVEQPTLAVRTAAATAAPVPTDAASGEDTAEASLAEQLAILSFEPAGETYAVTSTLQTVAFPEGVESRPGPWSPDGAHLVAFELKDGAVAEQPVGRVWTVDAETGEPKWDSGDVQDLLGYAPSLAAWRADGALVLPRADGMVVAPDGTADVDVLGIAGQPREVELSPDGYTVFANGPDGSWLIGSDGVARAVAGRPSAGFDSWSWSPDGATLGLARTSGDYYLLDVASATAERVAKAPPAGLAGRMPRPRWLSNQRMLLSNATTARTSAGAVLDHRIVNPDGGRSDSLPGLLEVPLNVTMPVDASDWVSPDGAWIVYPITEADPEAPVTAPRYVHSSSLLVDVGGAKMRVLPTVVDPVWSPDNRRIAFKADGALAVFDRVDGAARIMAQPDANVVAYTWSPDGLWLLYTDESDGLWIVAANRQAGPSKLADTVTWQPGPSWSPDSSRFAVTVDLPDEGPRLALYTIGLDG